MDNKLLAHIENIAKADSQSKVQMTISLHWISRLAADGLDEVVNDDEYQTHLLNLDLGICPLCQDITSADDILCIDCQFAEDKAWADYQEEKQMAYLVGVGRG